MLFVNSVGRHSSVKTTYKTFAVHGNTILEFLILKNHFGKGVSDLETCKDYFAHLGRSCENLNSCFPVQTA